MQNPVPPLSVAPMEGITNFPMRLWLHLTAQPPSMTTPFLRVTRVFPDRELPRDYIPELVALRGVLPYQLVPQYITGDPLQFIRAAALIPKDLAPTIEINCGCPSPNSLGKFAGSGMLQDPDLFGQTIGVLTQELGEGRLAVKMRLGIDSPAEFPRLLEAIADLPLGRLTVHGRTRQDGYRGQARWDGIRLAAENFPANVLASGDVVGRASLQSLLRVAPAISGVMIGRGVLRNPWIFEELRTNRVVSIAGLTLINALFCYVLLQELWQSSPHKLLQRVGQGRIGKPCRLDFAAWEKLTVELTSLVFGVPFLITRRDDLALRSLSSVAMGRLRILWAYLRSSLPKQFAAPSIMRAKSLSDFFQQIFMVSESCASEDELIEIGHQPDWDQLFARTRG